MKDQSHMAYKVARTAIRSPDSFSLSLELPLCNDCEVFGVIINQWSGKKSSKMGLLLGVATCTRRVELIIYSTCKLIFSFGYRVPPGVSEDQYCARPFTLALFYPGGHMLGTISCIRVALTCEMLADCLVRSTIPSFKRN